MFARITHYKMKSGSVDSAKALLETLKPKIMSLPGMIRFINTMNDDGTGCVVSLIESEETSNANAAATQAIWANFKDHLAEIPEPGGFDVIADWAK